MIHLKGPYRANHDHIETSVHCIHTIFNKEIWILFVPHKSKTLYEYTRDDPGSLYIAL